MPLPRSDTLRTLAARTVRRVRGGSATLRRAVARLARQATRGIDPAHTRTPGPKVTPEGTRQVALARWRLGPRGAGLHP